MAYRDLQSFIKELQSHDQLIEINEEVDANLEITEISNRIMKSNKQNKALLFNNIKGSPYPLLINAFGSKERMSLAFEVDTLDQIANDIKYFFNFSNYKTLPKQIKALPKLVRLYLSFPHKVRKAKCQEVVEEPNLDTIPILKCWPEDGGKFFTLPLVITKDPETGQQNMGMYRMQVYDHKTTGMHWHWHKDGREIYDKYRKLGKTKMPVSVVVGSDPATIYSATSPLPKMIDEMMLASFLRRRSLSIVKCITNDLYVPANAEFVFEGYIDINEDLRLEGPFGDHTGYYSLPDMYPIFHIEKITRRKKPIFHATIVGIPPMEDCYLALATEKIFIPLIQITTPEVVDLHMPFEGVFHNFAITSIKKHFPKHAHKVLSSLWGTGQMMYEKLICIVDESKDIKNYADIFWTVVDHVNLKDDIIITEGPLDALDHSSKRAFYGARLGIDATTKLKEEITSANDEKAFYISNIDKDVILNDLKSKFDNIVDVRLPKNDDYNKVLLISMNKTKIDEVNSINQYLRSHEVYRYFKFIGIFNQFTDIQDTSMTFWRLFNNIDAKRDLYFKELKANENTYTVVTVDATRKLPIENGNRNWPNDIIMDQNIIKKVNEKWLDYGFIQEND
ncbi:MAG: 3-octaprenyl-4hydroxybenzoate decarboxylase [Haloplasmataceae bacterium]|jgi:4-hydroxy-3-polyprenylbenzoate decarboxylase|nr:3-octaprenyl-4hydroxybenzoate decarboxylase [Haloplasmataceae bacterium]